MKIEQTYKVMGQFRTELIRRDGTVRFDSGFNKNLIVDAGLAFLVSEAATARLVNIRTLQVGSGNTAPANGDTQLQTLVATEVQNHAAPAADTDYAITTEIVGSDAIGHMDRRWLFDFNEAIDNLREVGVRFDSSGTLWARDLLRDVGGNPITIEKTADDQLRVTYRISIYVTLAEVLVEDKELTLLGVATPTDVRVRPQNMPSAILLTNISSTESGVISAGPGAFLSGTLILYPDNTPRGVFTQAGPVSTANSVSVLCTGVSGSFVTDVQNGNAAGVYWIQRTMRIATSAGNVAGGLIGSITVHCGNSAGAFGSTFPPFIIHFSPKIPKDSTQRLDITIRHNFERV